MDVVRSTTDVHPRLFVEHGDLFDLKNGFDGIAAFIPCCCSGFNWACQSFMGCCPPSIVMTVDNNRQGNEYEESRVWPKVLKAMDDLVSRGATRIGMNGIRTTGASEHATVAACKRWLLEYGERYPNVTITLVDQKNSFRHWAREDVKRCVSKG